MAGLDSVSEGYLTLSSQYLDGAGQIASDTFKNLGSWRDEDVQRFIDEIATPLAGIKANQAEATIAYHRAFALANGKSFKPLDVAGFNLSTQALRNGVNIEDVYRRPFVQMRMAIAKGKSVTDAIDTGSLTARNLARTEVQLTKRQVSLFARRANDNIVGYLRTLTGRENCGLCYVASTQRYRKGNLMPIHPGCDCGEMPIYGDSDPGQVIDRQLLDASHEAVGDRFGFSDVGAREPDYRKITIRDHGELGPLLTVKGHKFTGPNSLDLTGKKMPVKPPAVVSSDAIASIKAKRERLATGEQISAEASGAVFKRPTARIKATVGNRETEIFGKTPSTKMQQYLDDVLDLGRDADVEISRRTSVALKEANLGDRTELVKAEALAKKLYDDEYEKFSGWADRVRAEAEAKIFALNQKLIDAGEASIETVRLEAQRFGTSEVLKLRNSPAYAKLESRIDELYNAWIDTRQAVRKFDNEIAVIRAEETRKLIAEVRSVGKGIRPVYSKGSSVAKYVDYALDQYPDEWLNLAYDRFPRLGIRKVERGWFSASSREIRISGDTRVAPGILSDASNTALHEVGHMMEYSVPGLKDLEWTFYHRRNKESGWNIQNIYQGKEPGAVDSWRQPYTGKYYGTPVGDNTQAWEIFTTGVESTLGSSDHFGSRNIASKRPEIQALGEDTEFRQFILGVLLGL